ncbi:BRO family protein [Oleidesulfovibrio sp.]|uniref:BRO family protein n=1 Tax=Oleidesulfovibrio sp. TaxID=2909707 RepID=UPI003A8A2CBC
MSPSSITPFAFGDNMVRVHTDADGELWFVAKDVCQVLELANVSEALKGLDSDEKITLSNPDGNPRAGIPHCHNLISESGLYALVFRSRKPEAKAFSKWVRAEVLPALRKAGSYAVSSSNSEHLAMQLPSIEAMPEEIHRLRPAVRARLWQDSLQAARLEGAGMAYAIECFSRLCIIMGTVKPDAITSQQQDIRQFVAECCHDVKGATTAFADLYEAFRHWRKGNGDMPSKKVFGTTLGELFGKHRSNGSHYKDVRLLT